MTVYDFRAISSSGQMVEESIEAASVDDANSALETRGFTPLDVVERLGASAGVKKGSATSSIRMKRRDLAVFSRQFGTMLKAGVTVARGLETLRDQAEENLEPLFDGLITAVDQGDPLSEAFGRYPRSFNKLFVSTVMAAEKVGALATAFRQLGDILAWELSIKRRVRSALQYPATVIVVASGAVIVLTQLVVPQFAKFFNSMGGDLPLPTKLLLGMSSAVSNYWWLGIAAVVGLVFAFRNYYRTAGGRLLIDRYLLKLPLVGKLLHRSYLARFARVLGLLQANGLPILTTLEVLGGAIGNAEIADQIDKVREQVRQGGSLADAVSRSDTFTPMVKNMVRVGEESGSLDEALETVCEFYDEEVDTAIAGLTQAIEPILTVFLGGFVLFLALAIFLPWWDMNSMYSK